MISGRRAPAGRADRPLIEIRKHSAASIYVQADGRAGLTAPGCLLAVEEGFGRLDVLVNNAGIAPRVRADILEAHEDSFDEMIATNLKGPYFLTQAVAAWMIRQHASGPASRIAPSLTLAPSPRQWPA